MNRQPRLLDSLRYALGCVELSGAHGRVTGTDGKQLLSFTGLDFPWQEDVLVEFGCALGSPELRQVSEVCIGISDRRFLLDCHPWSFAFPRKTDARYPDVDRVLPDPAGAVGRARLAELDRKFLVENLSRLSGANRQFSPVTVELNGHIALLAADAEREQVTRSCSPNRPTTAVTSVFLPTGSSSSEPRSWGSRRFASLRRIGPSSAVATGARMCGCRYPLITWRNPSSRRFASNRVPPCSIHPSLGAKDARRNRSLQVLRGRSSSSWLQWRRIWPAAFDQMQL